MDDFSTNPARVILQICVTDLPGCPQNRHNTLADIFCRQVLNRRYCYELQLPAYDHMHIPPHFDTDKPVRRWFVLDLNVQSRLSRDEVLSLPHAVYSVSWQENRWLFIPRERYIEKAKAYCCTFYWGGRQEQELVAELKLNAS